MPTYKVDLAFLDDEGEQCWRKFFCTEISKLAQLVLGESVFTSRVSIISVGRLKNISIGDEVFEIYETSPVHQASPHGSAGGPNTNCSTRLRLSPVAFDAACSSNGRSAMPPPRIDGA